MLLGGGGGLRGRPASAAFASVVATDESLIYVMPGLGLHRRWTWRRCVLHQSRSFLRFSGVEVEADGEGFKVSMGVSAAANVMYLRQWALSRRL
jgi:hypothetical protein